MKAVKKQFTVIVNQAAYGSSSGQSTLEATLAISIFDQPLSIVFTEDGIYQLLTEGNTAEIFLKDYRKQFCELSAYGIKKLYVDRASAHQRGITKDDLLPAADWISHNQIAEILSRSDHILSF